MATFNMEKIDVELVIKQTRAATQTEIDRFYIFIANALNNNSDDLVSGLQHMFLLLHCSKKNKHVPQSITEGLAKLLLRSTAPLSATLKTLCREILQEMAPFEKPSFDSVDTCTHNQNIPDVLSVIVNQGPKFGNFVKNIFEIPPLILNNKMDISVRLRGLIFFAQIVHLPRHFLSKDVYDIISDKMTEFLRQACIYQAPHPYMTNVLSLKKMDIKYVTEVDGTPSQDLFTVLNIGKYYFEDQLLSIQCFSMLKKWLHYSDYESSQISISNTTNATKLQVVALSYCKRIFDQCERKSTDAHNGLLQIACISEVISILDIMCLQDQNLVGRIYDIVRRIYKKVQMEQIYLSAYIPVIQFFVNHCQVLEHDSQDIYTLFFTSVLSQYYHHPVFTYQIVMFLLKNIPKFSAGKSDVLTRYFPNILKILAWYPYTFLKDFSFILPSMIISTTALEVFHTLLDLPCTTALLEMKSMEYGPIQMNDPTSRQIFQNPEYIPLFNFALREQSGSGDTINKLNILHGLVADFMPYPRVIFCAQAIIPLFKQYFRIVMENADSFKIAKSLLPAMLERVRLIYPEPIFTEEIKQILSEELIVIIKTYPSLVVELHSEILEYLSSVRKSEQVENFFSHMIWIIGEYTSAKFNMSCTPNIITTNYEILEPITYELHNSLSSCDQRGYRLISILITALAKLAANCQDLLPRVLLCLSKVAQQPQNDGNAASRAYVVGKAKELMCMLKLPNVASSILNPSVQVENQGWHCEVTALPLVLKSTANLLQN